MSELTHFSCFSGIAGIDFASCRAGFETVGLVEIEDYPNKILTKRFGNVPRWKDIRTVTRESLDERGIKDVTVMSGGFPCFPAGTLIETSHGYQEIETLSVGMEVRTHLGRFRKITSVMNREAPVMRVYVQGTLPIEVTEEHPFYCRTRVEKHPHRGNVQYVFEYPRWINSNDLSKSDFVGLPLNVPSIGEYDDHILTKWYLVGHYLGNGWIVNYKRKNRISSHYWKVIICDGYADSDNLAKHISNAGFHATISNERSGVKFHISSKTLVEFFKPFGSGAGNKQIPGFVFDLPLDIQKSIFRGWIDSDGYENESVICGTTISKKLALGMARIARSTLRIPTTIRKVSLPEKTIIEGRTVNQKPFYQVRCWKNSKLIQKWDEKICWFRVRKIEKLSQVKTVYNISVEEDESYVADECIVHNCQPFSTAGKRKGKHDDRYLWPETIRVLGLLKPRWFIGENVAGITSMASPEPLFKLEEKESIKYCYERILAEISRDLQKEGFLLPKCTDGTPVIFLVPACGVGAPHRRYRVFIVAHNSNSDNLRRNNGATQGKGIFREQTRDETGTGDQQPPAFVTIPDREWKLQQEGALKDKRGWIGNGCKGNTPSDPEDYRRNGGTKTHRWNEQDRIERGKVGDELIRQNNDVANSDSKGSQGHWRYDECSGQRASWERTWEKPWIEVATRFCGIYDGVSDQLDGSGRGSFVPSRRNRLQRLKALGNAVVPAQVYPFFKYIAEIEKVL